MKSEFSATSFAICISKISHVLSFSVKLIYQFSYLIYCFFCFLDALKKASNKKESRKKMKIVEVLQQASYRRKSLRLRILAFDLVFVGSNNTDFNFIFCYYRLFSKSQFSGVLLKYIKLWVAICIFPCNMWVIRKIGCFMWK